MRTLNTVLVCSVIIAFTLFTVESQAADKYKRGKSKDESASAALPADGEQKDAKPSESKNVKKDDKVDVKDLEERYWTAKDTEFKVVQNRLYTKEKKFSVTPMAGPLLFDPYTSSFNFGAVANYYFSERHGVEVTGYVTSGTESDVSSYFKTTYGTGPDMNFPRGFVGASYNWVPVYAKLSLLEHKILYFDMGLSPGLGVTMLESISNVGPGGIKPATKTQYAPTFSLDLYQQVFLSEHWALRVDFRNHLYPEKVYNANTGDERRSKMTYSASFLLGVTFFQ